MARCPIWCRPAIAGLAIAGLVMVLLIGCAKQPPPQPETIPSSQMQPATRAFDPEEAARRERNRQATLTEQARLAEQRRLSETNAAQQREEQRRAAREAFMNQDIHFDYDSYTLRDDAKAILEQKAAWLMKHPEVSVQIEGHCDERGTNAYNLALGERRANAAKQYLTLLGVASSRLSTISYGEERPLDPGDGEIAWARNRRAHFVILNSQQSI